MRCEINMDERLGVLFLFIVTINVVFAAPRINSGNANSKKAGNVKKHLRDDVSYNTSEEYTDSAEKNDSYGDSYSKGSKDKSDQGTSSDSYYSDSKEKQETDYDYSVENGTHTEAGCRSKQKYTSERSVRVGDTFTPQEMLPITKKLIAKADNPGEGNGIVSSSKSAEALADTLFQALFISTKRIVILEENDLSGLDALQALALNGDVADLRMAAVNSYTERPSGKLNVLGEAMSKREPGKCHYRVITKKVEKNEKSNMKRRQAIMLAKKLSKKRHLIVKTGRKSKKGNSARESVAKRKTKNGIARQRLNKTHRNVARNKKNKNIVPKLRRHKHKQNKKAPIRTDCHWKYQCKDRMNLDTCRLHMICAKDGSRTATYTTDGIFMQHQEDEHLVSIKQFRKMLGITILDEEVEKIIENHILRKRPDRFSGSEKIQTLEEYFNGILISEHAGTTTAVTPALSSENNMHSEEQKSDEVVVEADKDYTPLSTQIAGERRRRFLSTKPMMKTKPTTK